MATSNIYFDDQTQYGRLLRRGLNYLEDGKDILNDVLASMVHMIDGDGSVDTHFTEVTARYGFPSNAIAKDCWDELNSVMAKLNTDTSVTSVDAAMSQVFAKMR